MENIYKLGTFYNSESRTNTIILPRSYDCESLTLFGENPNILMHDVLKQYNNDISLTHNFTMIYKGKKFNIPLEELAGVFKNESFTLEYKEDYKINDCNCHTVTLVEDYRTRHDFNIYYENFVNKDYSIIIDFEVVYNIDNV